MPSPIAEILEWLGNLIMDLLGIVSAFINWIGGFFMKNPWPAITLVLIILVFFIPWTRFVIKDLVKSLGLKRLKFSGTEIEFVQEDKLVIQRTFEESFEIIRQYRRKVEKNIDRLNRKTGLRAAFVEAAAAIFEKQFGSKFGRDGMRATIHVLDFIFEDRLYQITGYYPDGGGTTPSGRTARWATDHRRRQRSCQTLMYRITLYANHHMGAGNHARLSHKRWTT